MANKVTIIKYHYVRDLKNSRFNEIKGLDVSLFKEQADSQEDKAEDIQEDAEPSNNPRMMGCHELQLGQPE